MFNQMENSLLRNSGQFYLPENLSLGKKITAFSLLFFVLFFSVSTLSAQTRKPEKASNQRKLNSKPLDTGTKEKKFEELSDFVLVDYRAGAVPNVIEPDGEETSLKKDLEAQFPSKTVFATSDPQVCVIGVESSADAKTVLAKTNPKKSRIAKRDNIGKMLAEKNVKLITKEK
jgi:hypothetical protein